jgi:hypothetical protein
MSSMPRPGSTVEPLLEERYEVTRIAAGTGGAELDPLDPAIHPVKCEIEAPCSRSLVRQTLHQICGEPLRRQHQIGGLGDRLGKAQPHAPARHFAERRQRLGQVVRPQRAGGVFEQLGVELLPAEPGAFVFANVAQPMANIRTW